MDATKVESPQKAKPTAQPPLPAVSFSSLPDEIVLICLARTSVSYYRSLSLVCKRFHSLLSPPEIYATRSLIGITEPRVYISMWSPNDGSGLFILQNLDQTLINNGQIKGELSLKPVKLSNACPPDLLSLTNVVVGSEIYQIGGAINDIYATRSVRVLDCRSHTCRRAPDMGVLRRGAKSCFLDGKIYVMGGLVQRGGGFISWGEVFDLKTQTWKPLPCPGDNGEVPNEDVAVFGERLYVFTKNNNYVYDSEEGRWLPGVDIQHITGPRYGIKKVMERVTGPWCVINNVMFTDDNRKYKWYSSSHGRWFKLEGLNDIYQKRGYDYRTIQLVNYCGKLLIIWHEGIRILEGEQHVCSPYKRVWCAVIRLEEHLSYSVPLIRGKVERLNVIVPTIHTSYNLLHRLNLLRCLFVSV